MEEGETPRQAAERELDEETGIKADIPEEPVMVMDTEYGGTHFRVHVFVARMKVCRDAKLSPEHTTSAWFVKSEALSLHKLPEVTETAIRDHMRC